MYIGLLIVIMALLAVVVPQLACSNTAAVENALRDQTARTARIERFDARQSLRN